MNYSYLSDGTKLSALDGSGEGLVYRGPFVYRKSSGSNATSSLTLESAAFGGGRMTPDGALLYVTDYLGSVRAVVDGKTGNLYKASEYSAFGDESQVMVSGQGSTPAHALATAALPTGLTLRDAYTGKESQTPDFSTGYTDFGARQYSPTLRRWMTPDPLSEKYYGVSPYAFCNNNPVNFVDPDGEDIIISGLNNSSLVFFTKDYNYHIDLADFNVDFGSNYYFEGQETLQVGLDIIGLFDPSGLADFANSGIYLSVGDYGNAALSAVGILPYIGDLAKCSRLKKGLDAVEAIVKTNKHHLIPKAVYNQFSDVAEFMARDSKVNLLEVPAGFHGNHPAYSKWVTRELEELARDGMTYEKLMDFKRKAVEEIEHAYKIWIDSGKSNNANMNEYFKKLNSHE